jgi:hypothetical protein
MGASIEIKQVVLSVREGLLAARPASQNVQGQFYFATDTGVLYLSLGTSWVAVGPGSSGTLTGADNGLSLDGTIAQLGGDLISPTIIGVNGESLKIQNDNQHVVVVNPTNFQVTMNNGVDVATLVIADNGTLSIQFTDGSGNANEMVFFPANMFIQTNDSGGNSNEFSQSATETLLSCFNSASTLAATLSLDNTGHVFLMAGLSFTNANLGTLEIRTDRVSLNYTDASGDRQSIIFESGTMTVTDLAGLAGLQNAADYSANFINESLVTMRYVLAQIAAIVKVTSFNGRSGVVVLTSADVTTALTYTPVNKAGDTMTGALDVKALLYGGSANLSGVSLIGFFNSMPAGQLLIGWNRSGGEAEIDFLMTPGTAGSTQGGFNWYKIDNAGTQTLLAALNGNTGDFQPLGRLVPTVVDNSFTTPAQVLSINPITDAIEQRSFALFKSDLGIAYSSFAKSDFLNRSASFTVLSVTSAAAAANTYRINGYLDVITATAAAIVVTLSWVNSAGGAPSTVTLVSVSVPGGFRVQTSTIRCSPSTTISVSLTLTGTASFNVGALLEIQN